MVNIFSLFVAPISSLQTTLIPILPFTSHPNHSSTFTSFPFRPTVSSFLPPISFASHLPHLPLGPSNSPQLTSVLSYLLPTFPSFSLPTLPSSLLFSFPLSLSPTQPLFPSTFVSPLIYCFFIRYFSLPFVFVSSIYLSHLYPLLIVYLPQLHCGRSSNTQQYFRAVSRLVVCYPPYPPYV